MKKIKQILWFRNKITHNILSDKRGVSVALSTLIITAAVIAAGISVLYWAYSWGNIANDQYTQTINSNQNATSERLGFEYTSYSANKLSIYLINCGQVDDIAVVRVYIWDNSGHIVGTYPTTTSAMSDLKYISNDAFIPGNCLGAGEEGYFTIENLNLSPGQLYTLRVVTQRGRNFDGSITA